MPGKTKKPTTARCRFPVPSFPDYQEIITTCAQDSAKIKACSDYPNQSAVQICVNNLDAAVGELNTTITDLGKAEALVESLKTQRDNNTFVVLRVHGTLESTLDQVCNGDVASITAWGGQVGTRVKYDPTLAGPLNVRATSNLIEGTAIVRCQADPRAYAYLFQMGPTADPTNWPAAVQESGSKHHFTGLTSHTRMYFRMAIMRRGVGAGAWSDVVSVVVK